MVGWVSDGVNTANTKEAGSSSGNATVGLHRRRQPAQRDRRAAHGEGHDQRHQGPPQRQERRAGEGEATIKDSRVTANGKRGVTAWKKDEGGKAVVTIGDKVECSDKNAGNHPNSADYKAKAGGTIPGLPDERVVFAA